MKKSQKDNLIKALEELNAPDKDVLLQKIESKKALGGDREISKKPQKSAAKRNRRVAWTAAACSVCVLIVALILISMSIFGFGGAQSPDNGDNRPSSDGTIDYRASWKFKYYDNISFDAVGGNMKNLDVELIYDYNTNWEIIDTQVTQDESAYREYYEKDGVVIRVTVFLKPKISQIEEEYKKIIEGTNYTSVVKGNYKVYKSLYYVGAKRKTAYVIYLKEQVYVIDSDADISYLFDENAR